MKQNVITWIGVLILIVGCGSPGPIMVQDESRGVDVFTTVEAISNLRLVDDGTYLALSASAPEVSVLQGHNQSSRLEFTKDIVHPDWSNGTDRIWNIVTESGGSRVIFIGESAIYSVDDHSAGVVEEKIRIFMPLGNAVIISGRAFVSELPYLGHPPIMELGRNLQPIHRFGVTLNNSGREQLSPALHQLLLANLGGDRLLAVNRFSGDCYIYMLSGQLLESYRLLEHLGMAEIRRLSDDPRMLLIQDIDSVEGHIGVLLTGLNLGRQLRTQVLLIDEQMNSIQRTVISKSEGTPISLCYEAGLESFLIVFRDGEEYRITRFWAGSNVEDSPNGGIK